MLLLLLRTAAVVIGGLRPPATDRTDRGPATARLARTAATDRTDRLGATARTARGAATGRTARAPASAR